MFKIFLNFTFYFTSGNFEIIDVIEVKLVAVFHF